MALNVPRGPGIHYYRGAVVRTGGPIPTIHPVLAYLAYAYTYGPALGIALGFVGYNIYRFISHVVGQVQILVTYGWDYYFNSALEGLTRY